MNTKPGKLFAIRGSRDSAHDSDWGREDRDSQPAEFQGDSLLDLARSMRNTNSARNTQAKPLFIAVTSDPDRYSAPEFRRIKADLVTVADGLEAMEYLHHERERTVAILTDFEFPGRTSENGYRVVEGLRAHNYTGAAMVVLKSEPMAHETDYAMRRGANAMVAFGSSRMLRILTELAMAYAAKGSGESGDARQRAQGAYPSWLDGIIKHLARYAGPSAGDTVRSTYTLMMTRFQVPPSYSALVDEVAEELSDWPEDRLRFIAEATLDAKGKA